MCCLDDSICADEGLIPVQRKGRNLAEYLKVLVVLQLVCVKNFLKTSMLFLYHYSLDLCRMFFYDGFFLDEWPI